jgi:transposase
LGNSKPGTHAAKYFRSSSRLSSNSSSTRLRRRPSAFTKGRDFAAWLGLVPKQISTGDRTILGKISKRGNRYLRVLFVQAAWAVLIKPKSWQRHGLKPWLEAAKKRLHHNVLAIALANKLARIAWGVLAHGRTFEASKMQVA